MFLLYPCLVLLALFSTVTEAQIEKRYSNDFMGLLAKYQVQHKRFNNDFYGMLGRYQQKPYKSFYTEKRDDPDYEPY